MSFESVGILTDHELEEFREKTTGVSREKWKRLRAEGKPATVIRLLGGPLDGVPNVLDSEANGLLGWCKSTDRGLVLAHYRRAPDGAWCFDES